MRFNSIIYPEGLAIMKSLGLDGKIKELQINRGFLSERIDLSERKRIRKDPFVRNNGVYRLLLFWGLEKYLIFLQSLQSSRWLIRRKLFSFFENISDFSSKPFLRKFL